MRPQNLSRAELWRSLVTLKKKNSFSGMVRMKTLVECLRKEEENQEKGKNNSSFAVGESRETR